tara:strand:+ start:256 stop:762 length:507 start_codon:yes stop_codon:yes gene_type:complete
MYKPFPTLLCGGCRNSWGTFPSYICGPTNIKCSHCGEIRKSMLKPWSILSEGEKKSTIIQCLWGRVIQYFWLVLTFTLGPFCIVGFFYSFSQASNVSALGWPEFFVLLLGLAVIIWYVLLKKEQAERWKEFFSGVEKKYYESSTKKEDCFFESKDYEIDLEDLSNLFN